MTDELPPEMARNIKTVHLPILDSYSDRCEVYHCQAPAVERCGRRDIRICAVHLEADSGCQAIHRTLDGRPIYRQVVS